MRYISLFVTVLFVVALVGCTHLPPSDYEQTSEEQNMDEETPELNFSMFNSADNQIF